MRRLVFLALTLLTAASFAAFAGQTPAGAQPSAIHVVATSASTFQVSASFNTDEFPVSFSVSSGTGVNSVSLVSCTHAVLGDCTGLVPDADTSPISYSTTASLANADVNATNDAVTFVVAVSLNCSVATSVTVSATQNASTLTAPVSCGSGYTGVPFYTNPYYSSGCAYSSYCGYTGCVDIYNTCASLSCYNAFATCASNGCINGYNTCAANGCYNGYNICASNACTTNYNSCVYSGYGCGYYNCSNPCFTTACNNPYYYQDPNKSAFITSGVAVYPGTNILLLPLHSRGFDNGINGTTATQNNFAYAAQQAAAAQAAAAQAAAYAAAAQQQQLVPPSTGEAGLADPQYPFLTYYSEVPADQLANIAPADDGSGE